MSTDKKRKSHSSRDDDARPNKKPALESLLSLPPLKASTIEDGSEFTPVLGTPILPQNSPLKLRKKLIMYSRHAWFGTLEESAPIDGVL